MIGPATSLTGATTASRDVRDLVRHLEADAIGHLTAAAGNDSLCTLSRSGEPRPAAKYHEGAVAVLAQVRRAVDAQGHAQDAAATVRGVRDRWAARAVTDTPAWRAYQDGGLDALDTLLSSSLDDSRQDSKDDGTAPPARRDAPSSIAATTSEPDHGPATAALRGVALRRGGGRLSRRRVVVAAVLAPALFAALASTGGGWTSTEAPLWTALVALTALVSSVTLATYAPLRGQGWRPDVGCSPCAAMSAGGVLVAAWLLGSAPLQPTMAVVALAVVSFGLVQRLSAAASCST